MRKKSVSKKVSDILKIILDKKGEDIKIFNVKKLSDIWDYFILCSGTSPIHVKSIYEYLDVLMKRQNEEILHKDISTDYKWIVLDYSDILIHIFDKETREYYSLEKLWGEKEESIKKFLNNRKGDRYDRKKEEKIKNK